MKKALTDELAEKIKGILFSGELKRGQKLQGEVCLAARFGVGRSSVREALKHLSAEGYIELIPNRGAFAAIVSEDELPSPKDSAINWLNLNRNSVYELFEVRACIEPFAAERCADNIDDEGVQRLKAELVSFQNAISAGDNALEAQLDYQFHKLILEYSRNQFLIGMYEQLLQIFMQYSHSSFRVMTKQSSTLTEHTMICDAIATHSPSEAKCAMQHHIAIAARRLRDISK